MELLRFATAGAVDDGKSTLIGRLLHDTRSILEDQLAAVERTRRARGDEYVNLALLLDGLRAEREQGITIDVAHRYFATARRQFILADTPGHLQYTRNMVTGASTADLALILVDARKGLQEQTRRHAFLASLLRVPHLVLCVNKMDLVGFDEAVFEAIREEFRRFSMKLEVTDLTFIPVCALDGDNVARRSERMPWYQGATLLHHLEHVHIASARDLIHVRFPVQGVIRPMSTRLPDYRAYTGQLLGGVLRPGDEVLVLPSGLTTRVRALELAGRSLPEAFPPMSLSVQLEDALDVGRGDMLSRPGNPPRVGQDLDAMVCWLSEARTLEAGARLALKLTTRAARTVVKRLHYRLDVNTLHRDEDGARLACNDIGRVTLRTTVPLLYDEYRRNRHTGSFILIDEATNATVGAGMINGPAL
ncbi:GTP-binding protein [Myxococcus sp. K15C18031901]|uniref:sulfate adenylyltransferase subunit 1 n=1 Tax=Myxococcus dinghuensis TaxID=2906761 RepID=UPI0020A7E582|nr:GTP-binding protein [Myxococcus dinghuensis]MCP3101724.1 GTP-binding protein [Myxococcus dinghuensis]